MRSLEEIVEALTSLSRTGWMLRGIPHTIAETVAEHSFHASLLALELSLRLRDMGYHIDPYKAAVIALVHDIGESIIGDIPRTAGIHDAKRNAEARAVSTLPIHDTIKALVSEFEELGSDEAVIARVAEMLATAAKARRYRLLGYEGVAEIEDNMVERVRAMLNGRVYGRALKEIASSQLGLPL